MITNSLFIKKSLFINNDFNKSSKKYKQNIVVVGNGIAGTTFIKHMNNPKYDITVVSPNPLCTYTPLIPYKSIKNNDIVISKDVRDIKKDISYIQSSISDIDLQTKELISEDSTRIKYDYVVFAHGSVNNTFNIKGIDDYCYFVNNDNIDDIYNKLNSLDDNSNISIIGSGFTGIEMVGYLMDLKKFNITIIDGLSTNHLMNNVNNCDYLVKHWENNNINTKFNNFVQSVTDKSIILKNDTIDYDMTIWCGGYKQTNLTAKLTDLLIGKFDIKSKRGLYISSFMEVYGNKYLYAIGDCTSTSYPPTAQVAHQQAIYLANHFNNDLVLKDIFTYNDKGTICYIGNNESIYEKGNDISIVGFPAYILNKLVYLYNYIRIL